MCTPARGDHQCPVPLVGPVYPCIIPVASAVISLTLSCRRLGAGAGAGAVAGLAKLRVLGPALAAAITAVIDII